MKELVINVDNETEKIFLVEDGVLTEKYYDSRYKKRLEGNIYIGKVQNIIPGLQAAFINVGENRNAFIHLKDVLPKKDITKEEDHDFDKCDIRDYLRPGMPIIVEIKRDSYNKKGARASTHINLPGRFLVLLPNSGFVTISQKIENKEKREKLVSYVKEIIPEGMGAIIRTSAEKATKNPKLIYKANEILDRLLIDILDKDLERIIVNTKELENKMKERMEFFGKKDVEIVLDTRKIEEMYELNKQLEVAENRKVWLKSGGFITIDKTEALTAIDVNSAKYTGKEKLEDTAFAINKESAIEIAKQIKLRDIGGIIVIDFIDLYDENNKKELIKIFERELKKERTKVQIEGFTKLNLLELTRKHICSE